ncbi:hypothetical protein SteCoe_27090 [Stentor coeruleus]|uniref:Uncharacterized protein n=1 Tax=Stentor coeruleus TaxID=5963 RepID=A0A1R2BB96_9CILI|nr:hypothetical protein SteCoe_27090 [Stentor coeruleus]
MKILFVSSVCVGLIGNYWFTQTWEADNFHYKFEGLLQNPNNSFELICSEGTCTINTSSLYSLYDLKSTDNFYMDCKAYHIYSYLYDNCHGDCDFIKTWDHASIVILGTFIPGIVISSICSTIFMLIACLPTSCYKLFKYGVKISVISHTIATILQFSGFIAYVAMVRLNINDCTHSFPYSGVNTVCAEFSSLYFIAQVIFSICLLGLYWIIYLSLDLNICF